MSNKNILNLYMALYIPYVIGCSFTAMVTKRVYNYMNNENIEINTKDNIKDNIFLNEEPVVLDNKEIEIEYNKKTINKEEEHKVESIENKIIEKEIIEKKKGNSLETIEEETEVLVNIYENNKIFCVSCKLYLTERCFSKNQFKKNKQNKKCKICTKLK